MNKVLLIIITILILMLSGCDDSSSPNPKFNILTGTVSRKDGTPVEGAKIIFTYNTEAAKERPESEIRFDLTSAGHVKLWIANHREDNNQKWLVDSEYPAGNHSVVWDGTNMQNERVLPNFYDIKLQIDDNAVRTQTVVFLYDDISSQSFDLQSELTTTSESGEYTINVLRQPFFYVDNMFTNSDGTVVSISKNVNVWVITNNGEHKTITDILIDENETKILDIVLD